MVEVLKKEYWSKSEAFLLPLTGLDKTQKYPMTTYLFWDKYSIDDYLLIVKFKHEDREEFLKYCKRVIFPRLDTNGYLIEMHDFPEETVFILDLSEWALDIEMFLKGKYSKMSREAKEMIAEYHTFFSNGPKLLIEISASLDPNSKFGILEGMTAIEYVAKNYEIDLDELKKIGELGGIYDRDKETLVMDEIEGGMCESV